MGWLGWLILLLVSVWVYRDSLDRGRSVGSAWGWAVGTFLLLIVVLPLHLITRPSKPQVLFQPMAAPELCPHCGSYFTGHPAFCPHCGEATGLRTAVKSRTSSFRQIPVAPPPQLAADAQEQQFCPYCGCHYNDRPIFCPQCDRQLRERTVDNILNS